MQTDFSAKAPALGYYYQIRYGLYLLLSKENGTEPFITIEGLDDLTVVDEQVESLYQTKVHLKPCTDLTIGNTDFWKTVRVWAKNVLDGLIDPKNVVCVLVTTQSISPDSILKEFRVGSNRDLNVLQKALIQTAEKSKNKTNKPAYKAFLGLSESQQQSLVDNIYIVDGEINIDELKIALETQLRLSAPRDKIQPLLERLEGWWFDECISHLLEKKDHISRQELLDKLFHITDELKSDNLPVDFPDPFEVHDQELESSKTAKYIRQLQLVQVGKNGLRTAISDYRRAYSQKSRWIRENLITPYEYVDFDNKLYDYWQRRFYQVLDEVNEEELSETEIVEKGKEFYIDNYVRVSPPVKIRERFNEAYMTVGGSHMLSDSLKIGWHPHYSKFIS